MKNYTKQISDILNNPPLKDRYNLNNLSNSLNVSEKTIYDENFGEFLVQLNNDLDVLQDAAKKEILDSLSPNIRKQLIDNLNKLVQNTKIVFFNKDVAEPNIKSFVDSAAALQNIIKYASLGLEIEELPTYSKRLSELSYLRSSVKKLISDYEASEVDFTEAKNNLENIKNSNIEINEVSKGINEINSNIKKISEEIKNKKVELQNQLAEINSFIPKYKELISQINNPESGFQTQINQSRNKFDQIKNFFNDSVQHHKLLQAKVEEYKVLLNNLNETKASLDNLFNKANDENTGINALLEEANDLNTKINKLFNEIQEFHKTTLDLSNKIEVLYGNAETRKGEIDDIKSKVDKTFSDIEDIYNIAADTAMGGEFNKRKDHFSTELRKWEKWIRRSSIALLVLIIILLILPAFIGNGIELDHIEFNIDFLLRLSVTSPIIFYLIFCTSQYAKAKSSYDKYSFKATMAFSIKNHINLLKEQFSGSEKEIVDFTLSALNRIYDEPFFDEQMKAKIDILKEEMKYGFYKAKSDYTSISEIDTETAE